MGGPAVLPPTQAAAASPAAATATPLVPVAEAKVERLPEKLQDIARPVVLTGTVAGTTPEGLTRVKTAAGEVLLNSPTPLPVDKPVTLQITPAQTAPPQTPAQPSAQTAPQAQAPQVQVQVQTGQSPPTLQTQAKPTALILLQATATPAGSGAPAAAPTIGSVPGQPAGAVGTPTIILQPSAPTPSAAAGLPLLTPGSIVPALVIAANPKPAGPASAPSTQPTVPGTQVTAKPDGTVPSAQAGQPGAATAMPAGQPAQAATPAAPTGLPMGRPMLDTPVQLGGDAGHPGADTPTLSAPPQEAPDLPKGATVALKILTVALPQPQPNQAAGQARPDGQGGDPASGQQPGGQQSADSAAQDAAPASDLPDAPILRGTVAGATPQGQPILATKQGMLALNVQASLPQGTKVTAALTDPAAALLTAPPLSAEPGPLTDRDWPAMRQLMASLAGIDQSLARSVMAGVPQPNRKLGAALSFFLSAIRGGDARSWLGEEAAGALERSGRGDLLAQLEKEFKSLQQQQAEPLPGDWRPFTLPMLDGQGLKPIQVHVHPLKEDEAGGKREGGKPGSRFLIDIDLSRFGPMQLDGLVRPNHFDLILRSNAPLPPELRVELIQVFADSVRAVGYSGGLSFQSGAKSWVKLTRAGKAGLGVSA